MGLKDFNYKQYFFDNGEKIGLAAAGLIALILGVWLIIPGSGLFATPAASRAADLKKTTDAVDSGLRSNTPNPDDKDDSPPKDVKERLVAFAFDIIPDGTIEKNYHVDVLFDNRHGGPSGRQMPTIKPPTASDIALVRFQLPGLVYSNDGEKLMTLKNVPGGAAGGTPGPGGTGGPSTKMPSGSGQFGPSQLQGAQGKKYKGRGILKDPNNPDTDKAERDFDVVWQKPEEVKENKLAMQPVPVRAAEIVAQFPYKEQIKEFMQKLGLPTEDAVLTETTTAEEKNQPLHTFRFLGLAVQRRTLDAQGAVVTTPDGGWTDLDLQDAYATLIVLSGGQDKLQPEKRFQKVAFAGLTLPRLPTVGDLRTPPIDEYPKIEDNLKDLKKTVDDLDTTPASAISKPAFTQRPDDIFHITPAAGPTNGPGPGGTGGPTPGGTGGPMLPGPPKAGPAAGGTTGPGTDVSPMGGAGGGTVVPDYCLIRLFDFTIEPGKTYEYRLRVRMANPNFARKDVASQGIAAEKELNQKPMDKDWYVLPKKLTVTQDLYYYAVDQAKLDADQAKIDAKDSTKDKDKDKDAPPKLPLQPVKADTQTVVQVQKWVDFLTLKRMDLAVGDWVIAERVAATRGEPIGRQRVEVPYWRQRQDRFTMMTDQPPPKPPADKKFVATVEVPFTPDGKEPILVDFMGGDATYRRTHPKTDDAPAPAPELPIADRAPEEVLLYTADGRLLAHNAAKDAADADRIKRLEDDRTWIDIVKRAKGGKDDKLFPDRPGNPNQ